MIKTTLKSSCLVLTLIFLGKIAYSQDSKLNDPAIDVCIFTNQTIKKALDQKYQIMSVNIRKLTVTINLGIPNSSQSITAYCEYTRKKTGFSLDRKLSELAINCGKTTDEFTRLYEAGKTIEAMKYKDKLEGCLKPLQDSAEEEKQFFINYALPLIKSGIYPINPDKTLLSDN